jgi:hypothetical protein
MTGWARHPAVSGAAGRVRALLAEQRCVLLEYHLALGEEDVLVAYLLEVTRKPTCPTG